MKLVGVSGLMQGADAVGDRVQRVGFEGQLHAAFGTELVHQDLGSGVAGDVLEEEGRAAGLGRALAEFGGAVGDFGHLEVGANGDADAAQFSGLVELLDPFAKVGIGHGCSWCGGGDPLPPYI